MAGSLQLLERAREPGLAGMECLGQALEVAWELGVCVCLSAEPGRRRRGDVGPKETAGAGSQRNR